MTSSFMASQKILFTSESVTEGHPDKMCDQISDAVLDACLEADPMSRVACEVATKTGFVLLMGEITTGAQVNYDELARRVINGIGYDHSDKGFDGSTCGVQVSICEQSCDIDRGVSNAYETRSDDSNEDELDLIGARDQGMMFGYACNETETYMPMPIYLAHKLTRRLAEVRKNGELPWVRPDGKSQVPVEYSHGKPVRIDTVLVSTQHAPDITHAEIEKAITDLVILPTLPAELVDARLKVYVNPTGRFVIGGPMGDSGLTGRKIIVDTYGGIPATQPRTLLQLGWLTAVNCRWLMQLAYPIRSRSMWKLSAPENSMKHALPRWLTRCLTSARAPSSGTSTCAGRFTSRPLPTATSGGMTWIFRGRNWIEWTL